MSPNTSKLPAPPTAYEIIESNRKILRESGYQAFYEGWRLILDDHSYERAMRSDDFDPHADFSEVLWEIENHLTHVDPKGNLTYWLMKAKELGAYAARDYSRYIHGAQ